ncbi:MAG TPA: gamma-glutamyltransferase [Flavobacteriaceae bacterium]|jgi:gamma-glutamyltranspeptidase/glutathione hydrolase|nr:gamma-glutamyltransferase [Flavobacteriaceae bacterium]|tara:strand:+ start:5874 stop:7562 length:1689 start_codon:yes stop_codon:yes gene_type:complete
MRSILVFILSVLIISCDKTYNPTVVSARKEASEIGVEIMKKGGNAYDAMIAVHLALAVAHPTAGNIGGGGFFVYYNSDGSSGSLDFREMAPGKAFKDMYLDKNGNVIPDMSTLGGAAVGVPGSISAIFEIHSKFGTLPIEDLFQPAIKLAQEGFIVTENQSSSLSEKLDNFIKINGKNSLYSKRYYKGDTIKNTKFAETLSKISKNGSKAFYEGEIAEMIIDEVIESGGIMTIEDLKNYKSIWRDPVIFNYKDLDIISMSLPSSGGILLGQMLKAIEDYDISRYGHNSLNAIQLMVEVERRAYADRSHFMGDPDFMNLPVYELIDKKYIQDRMNNFSWDIATPSSEIKHGNVIINESDETTHYSIIDKYGNSVSVTTTLNNSYGSKVYVEDGGFFLNNEMDDFSSKPGHPNFYGLIGSEANSIQPKKRMLSSMTPTIVLKDNKPSLIVGTPGGATIITSVFQTILNVYEFNMNVQDAVNAPRFHHQWLPDVIIIEKNGSDNRIDSLLRNKNYNVISLPFESEMSGMSPRSYIGAVDAIFIDENGKVSGGADYRGDDFAATLK